MLIRFRPVAPHTFIEVPLGLVASVCLCGGGEKVGGQDSILFCQGGFLFFG